jgi:ABC-2 type transport system permease protein
MPALLQKAMLLSPSTHFVSIAQAILYRGAGIDVVWPHYLIVALAGALFLWLAVLRFRQVTMQAT